LLSPIEFSSGVNLTQKAYRIYDPKLSEKCILVESVAAREILTDHFLIGSPLISKSKLAVKDCLSIFFAIQSELTPHSQIAEIVPLSGSLTYEVLNSFYELYKKPLSRSFIGIRRFQKPDGRWDSTTSYTNFEALAESPKAIVIGDTIATGVTMTKVIQMVQARLATPLTFIIISIAGSLIGAQRIVKLEESLQRSFPGTSIWCLFTEAFLGLEANGTDMPILHPDSISTTGLRELTKKRLGEYLGRNLCSVLDWGKRTNAPSKHYDELLEVLQELKGKNPSNTYIDQYIDQYHSRTSR
jgi:hypothetical protein